jgi:hypothetical protein
VHEAITDRDGQDGKFPIRSISTCSCLNLARIIKTWKLEIPICNCRKAAEASPKWRDNKSTTTLADASPPRLTVDGQVKMSTALMPLAGKGLKTSLLAELQHLTLSSMTPSECM